MSKTFYSHRTWLNPEDSRSTGSIVCFDGETEFAEGSVMCNEIDCFIKHLKTKLIDNETV